MTDKEYGQLFEQLMGENRSFLDVEKEIAKIKDETTAVAMKQGWCNCVLSFFSEGYTKYDKNVLLKDELIQAFIKEAHTIKKDWPYYEAVTQLLLGNNDACLSNLQPTIDALTPDEDGLCLTEADFIFLFFEPFKNAFPGFWNEISKRLSKKKCQGGIVELCSVIEDYYSDKSIDECIELLIPFSQKYPDLSLPKELLADLYYSKGMWRNAISYLEMISNTALFLPLSLIYFQLAWSHGKTKNLQQEEDYYRKSLKADPFRPFTKNNLAYCLMKQKRCEEALSILEECLQDHADLPYSANNYARCLIALGRNKDAKDFIKSGGFKIAKDLVNKAKSLSNTNSKPKLIKHNAIETINDTTEAEIEEDAEPAETKGKTDYSLKREQFSSEKILEDELTARIESGREVFGLKLKVYNHKGDYYGRQYPFPNGRLDLLCEDDNDNLYIIELKKDAGYDDVYKQTSEYLDYFGKHKISKGKNVYGIICLNGPSQKLIDQIKADDRMRLFEYQVSYHEIR